MQFNSEANNLDLYSDARYWCGIPTTDTTSFTIGEFTREANFALDMVTMRILKSDGRWQWDDTNNTDLLVGATDLESGRRDYRVAVTHLKIQKVRCKDANGNWITLDPVDRRDLSDAKLTEGNGTPRTYDKIGNHFYLYPAPNYSSTSGFEVQTQRGASYFATTDTTKVPGFATHFHRLISLYSALTYCEIHNLLKRVPVIQNRINLMEAELMEHMATRDRDEKPFMSLRKDDYGQQALGNSGRGFSNPDKFNV